MGLSLPSECCDGTIWELLALPEERLERVDLVTINLAVAKAIPSLGHLDIAGYRQKVQRWTEIFASELPTLEAAFQRTSDRWQNDINFFRIGQLAGHIGKVLGVRYIEAQKRAKSVRYTDPSDLFLNGVIDTRRGSCGNLAALHVAMSRQLGWPVSLACIKSHLISRYDDGKVVYNIEMSSVSDGTFSSDPDEYYVREFALPDRARACGSDLRYLTTREMLAVFLSLRARHFTDTGKHLDADRDFCLSRSLFPTYRKTYLSAMDATLRRGATLFHSGELGHPDTLVSSFAPIWSPNLTSQPIFTLQKP